MFFFLYERSPYGLNIIVGPLISYLASVMNIIVFLALTSKKIVSPSTVLMQGLALADSLTALTLYGLEPFIASNYKGISNSLCELQYPYCIIHYLSTQLADNFHLTSVLLTSCLGLQKMVAIAFPVWSRSKMSTERSFILCVFCFAFSVCIHIPRVILVAFNEYNNSSLCQLNEAFPNLDTYVLTTYPLLFTVILGIAVFSMIVSTVYITYKLCKRRTIRGTSSFTNYERQSCILILCVLVVFVVSEGPRLYINGTISNTYWEKTDKTQFVRERIRKDIARDANECLSGVTRRIFNEIQNNCQGGMSDDRSLVKERIVQLMENIVSFTSTNQEMNLFTKHTSETIGLLERYNKVVNKTFFSPSFVKDVNIEIVQTIVVSAYCSMIDPQDRSEFIKENSSCTNDSLQVMGLSIFRFMKTNIDQFFVAKAKYSVDNKYESFVFDITSNLTNQLTIKTINEDQVSKVWARCQERNTIIFTDYAECSLQLYNYLLTHLSLVILASSPYSEQFNYLINTVMDYRKTDLKYLKLLLESIKLATVIACASNFIIYIVMSSKLRREMRSRVLRCLQIKPDPHHSKRNSSSDPSVSLTKTTLF